MQLGPKQDYKNLTLGIGPLVGLLIRLAPPCKDVTRLVSEGMDRSLPLRTRLSLRVHFLICKWCERYKNQLLFMQQAIRRHPEKFEGQDSPSAPTLSPEARERIKRALAQEE